MERFSEKESGEEAKGERQDLQASPRLQHPKQGAVGEIRKVRLLQLRQNLLTIRNHRLCF